MYKNLLFYSFFYWMLFFVISKILMINNIFLIDCFFDVLIILGICISIAGIIQIILLIKKRWIKSVFGICGIIVILYGLFFLKIIILFNFNKTVLIEKNGKRMWIEYGNGFNNNIKIDYYDYINLFLKSYNPIESEILEDYYKEFNIYEYIEKNNKF